MCWRALVEFEKALGAKHTSTVSAAHNLAFLYKSQGKIGEAEKLGRHVSQEAALSSGPADMNEAKSQSGSSTTSDAGSIFSAGSESRTSSIASSERPEETIGSASDQLVALFLSDDAFVPLDATIVGGDHFARKFHRLLKQFARDLILEAQNLLNRPQRVLWDPV
jgi:hypothetical protein